MNATAVRSLIPIGDSIVIYPQQQQGGSSVIVSPETSQTSEPVWGTVVAVGPEYKGEIKRGMTVLMEMYSGQDKRVWLGEQGDEKEIRIIKEENILGFIQ